MAADNPTSFELIESTWTTLRDNFDDAQQRLTSVDDRKRLLSDRDHACLAYRAALGKQFDEQADFVVRTKKELSDATADMQNELTSLQDAAALLNAVSSAVKLAAALAGIAF